MKKIIKFLCPLILVSAVFFLLMPARWVVDDATKNISNIAYTRVNNFWWSGHVENANLVIRGYRVFIGDVKWQYIWSSILSKNLCARFVSVHETLQTEGKVCYHLVDKLVVLEQLSTRMLAEEVGAVSGLEIAGNFEGYFHKIILQARDVASISGDVAWKKARWHNGEKWIDLGEMLFTVVGDRHDIVVHGTDVDSPVKMDIDMTLNQAVLQSIIGYIEVTNATEPSLLSTLDFFAQEQQGRRYIFNQQF
jgi:hypothetical protein